MAEETFRLTPELMLRAYSVGLFPMADGAESEELSWYDPDPRGIMPLDGFHLSRRLCRTTLSGMFEVVADRGFENVMLACAAPGPGRESTWISSEILRLFCQLHEQGQAHSIETWRDGQLVGGLYGVAIGGVFFGESMFSRERDASKVALVHLVARMRLGGFILLDTQFGTSHLAQFGGEEIPAYQYKKLLARAVRMLNCWENFSADDTRITAEIAAMRDG